MKIDLTDLIENPREDLGIECKAWLDLNENIQRAKVARHIAALANYGGGYLLFGFNDDMTRDRNRPLADQIVLQSRCIFRHCPPVSDTLLPMRRDLRIHSKWGGVSRGASAQSYRRTHCLKSRTDRTTNQVARKALYRARTISGNPAPKALPSWVPKNGGH